MQASLPAHFYLPKYLFWAAPLHTVHGMYNFKYYYYTYLMKYLHCIIIEAHPWAFLLMYIKTIAWCMMTRCHLHGFASPTAKGMRTMVGLGKFHPDIRKHLFVKTIIIYPCTVFCIEFEPCICNFYVWSPRQIVKNEVSFSIWFELKVGFSAISTIKSF